MPTLAAMVGSMATLRRIEMNDKQLQLAKDVTSDFFSTRASIQEAFKYAYDMIDSLPAEAKTSAYTALHVVVNTIAQEITRNEG